MQGTVLAGWSAGAICWFEQGVTDSYADCLRPLDCLGFLPGSCCPHYDGEAERRPAYQELVREKQIMPGLAIEDGSAVLFQGQQIRRLITPSGQVGAWTVRAAYSAGEGSIVEQPLTADRVDY